MPDKDNSLPVKNLQSLLRQKIPNDFTIEDVDWKHLTKPGENFGSLIIAVNAKLRINSQTTMHNLVVKLPPPSAWLQELFNTPMTFVKELKFYRDITPAFIALQRENDISEVEKNWLGADFYGGRCGIDETEKFDEQSAIVLENLNFLGYRTVDRLVGLNLNHCEIAVGKLAKLHAITIAMRQKKLQDFEKIILPLLELQANNDISRNCLTDMITKSMDDLENIPKCCKYMTSVRKTMDYIGIVENSEKNVKKDHWATLVHNDFWVNNMMFKYDEFGNVNDMKIVDFQLYVYDYGVKDLIFFLISSPILRVIDENFDHLIDIYYDSFANTLTTMGIDIADFPKKQFHERLNECATLKFAQCIMMTQVIKSKHDVAPKMEDIKGKENFLMIGGGEIYQEKMLHTVEFFDKRGWLKK